MIDKAAAEIAAIRELGAFDLLCKFYVLQDRDRYLRKSPPTSALASLQSCDTNNFLELFFHKLKYDYCKGRRYSHLSTLVGLLLTVVISGQEAERIEKLAFVIKNRHEQTQAKHKRKVQLLLDSKGVIVGNTELGTAAVQSQTDSTVAYVVCVGELSCTCPHWKQTRQTCKHLQAAVTLIPLTRKIRCNAASMINDQQSAFSIQQGKVNCMPQCSPSKA